jgi:type IV pilus assembly protein PilM
VLGGAGSVVLGLDIGTTSVKALRMRHGRGGTALLGAAIEEVAPAEPGGGPEAVAGVRLAAVKAALARCGAADTTGVPVVTAVSGPGVSIKHVTFPAMPKQELAESIRWEARRHVPFGAAEFVLDFQVLDGASRRAEDETGMRVLLTAVERKLVDDRVALLNSGGIQVDTVDLVPLAVMNEADEEGLVGDQAVAVADLGATALNLTIYRRGGFLFARTIPFTSRPDGAAKGKGWLDEAVQEMRRSLTFYQNEAGRQAVDRIYITGGRALEDGAAGAFQKGTEIETAVLDPLAKLAAAEQSVESLRPQGPRFALAAGLARRRS